MIGIHSNLIINNPTLVKRACRALLMKITSVAVACFALVGFETFAEDYRLVLKNHVFVPAELIIPAEKKVRLVIYNQDDSAEEFDSFDLNREKVLFPNKKAVIFIGPLKAGRYEYFGEFHPDSAQGVVIAKSKEEIKND